MHSSLKQNILHRLILAAFLLAIAILAPTSGQNIERMCRQLNTNCAACQVYQAECSGIKPSTQKPDYGGGGGFPISPGGGGGDSGGGDVASVSIELFN